MDGRYFQFQQERATQAADRSRPTLPLPPVTILESPLCRQEPRVSFCYTQRCLTEQ